MSVKRGFLAFGVAITATVILAVNAGQLFAQNGAAGGAGSGGAGTGASGASDTSGTAGASTSGRNDNVAAGGTQSAQAGAQAGGQTSTTNPTGSTGAASTGAAQSSSPQGANNLLIETPGLPAQPQAGSQGQGVRPFDGQSTSGTSQPNQINQNPADVTAGRRGSMTDRSLIGDSSLQTQQRDLLKTIHFQQPITGRGPTIETLGPGSIFYDSGLRPGDVIIAFGGQPVRSDADFERLVLNQWGQRIPATVWRNGQEQTVFVTLGQDANGQLSQSQARSYQANRPIYPSTSGRAFLGVGFDTSRYGTASVRDIVRGSAAEQAGLRQGDIIVSLNGQPVSSYQEAIRIIGSMQAGEPLEIEYTRRMPNRAQATLGGRPSSGPSATEESPIDESRYYRGAPQRQTAPPQQQMETAPPEQEQAVPPPSLPADERPVTTDDLR